MSAFNQSRKNIIIGMILVMGLVVLYRLFAMQVLNTKYSVMADEQGTLRKVIYPSRGLLFDRNGRAILRNSVIYDLMVTPNKIRKMHLDTLALCGILGIDTAQFKSRILNAIIINKSYRPSVFDASLSDEKVARINESLYKWAPAFYLQERPVRDYPYDAAGNILGYLSEVSPGFLEAHQGEGYRPGDYAGRTGLERSYEKVLMGQRGIEYLKRDNRNRITGKLENGEYDTTAISGQSLYSALDIKLQMLGEHLMQNKVGAIVAIDPQTGGILAMVSSPTYHPDLLSGSERRSHFAKILLDPRKPMLNRAIGATYMPGSTFKTLQALVGLQEGMITPETRFLCTGAYYGCSRPIRCLDPGNFNLRDGIAFSCNTYFANVMERTINNRAFGSPDSALRVWDHYMYSFGLGHKLGIDLPGENSGLIPTPELYDSKYGKGHWNFCTIRSLSIGQGEVNVTPLQVANEMAYLANKGWYITPHIIDSIEGGDKYGLLDSFKTRHKPLNIPDNIFDAVQDGMEAVMERGTASAAKVPGIVVCGKTGTVENYYKGVKQRDHAFFAAFAPRENPRIAIAVICENAGYGSTSSAPIASLMIEQYIKDSIPGKERKALEEKISNMNLMPQQILDAIRKKDSIDAARIKVAQQKADSILKVKEAKELKIQEPKKNNEIRIEPQKSTSRSHKDTGKFKVINKDSLLPKKKDSNKMSAKNSVKEPLGSKGDTTSPKKQVDTSHTKSPANLPDKKKGNNLRNSSPNPSK